MNKMINSFLRHVPSEPWIVNSCGLPWLKLNVEVPDQKILDEADNLYHMAVEHRANDALGSYSHQGWKGLTIYGEGAKVTEHTEVAKHWTEIAEQCPITVEFIKQHWDIDGSTGRIRFMWLEPGGYILPHSDRDRSGFRETNIAIYNPAGCTFRFLDYGTVPFVNGSAYMVDISNRHLVYNDSIELRTHIIIHAKPKNGIIKSSYEQSFYN